MLNSNPIGGKRRSAHHDDLWCLKYLPKFKWDHLTEEMGGCTLGAHEIVWLGMHTHLPCSPMNLCHHTSITLAEMDVCCTVHQGNSSRVRCMARAHRHARSCISTFCLSEEVPAHACCCLCACMLKHSLRSSMTHCTCEGASDEPHSNHACMT